MKELDLALIEEMKRVAKEHPYEPAIAGTPTLECLWKEVSFDGEDDLEIMLTYEIYDQTVKAWHLSISRNKTAASQNTANKIAWLILGIGANMIPEKLFPPEVRFIKQYVQQIQ